MLMVVIGVTRGLSSYQVAQTVRFGGVSVSMDNVGFLVVTGVASHSHSHTNNEQGGRVCTSMCAGSGLCGCADGCHCVYVGVCRTYQLDRAVQNWDSPNIRDQRHRQHRQLPENLFQEIYKMY